MKSQPKETASAVLASTCHVIAAPVRPRDLDLAVLGETGENHGGERRGRA